MVQLFGEIYRKSVVSLKWFVLSMVMDHRPKGMIMCPSCMPLLGGRTHHLMPQLTLLSAFIPFVQPVSTPTHDCANSPGALASNGWTAANALRTTKVVAPIVVATATPSANFPHPQH